MEGEIVVGSGRMSKLCALIVDDNEINIKILSRMLRREGVKIIVGNNGEEGVEKVKSIGPDNIDIIFMDLQMPVMDGFEATRQIRKNENEKNIHTPIFAVTASISEEDCENAYAAGVDEILEKPVRLDDLINALKNKGLLGE